MKKQQGFTLIELIMVIVILGILSAFALPRFADLSGNAEQASIEGALGAAKSASAIAHASALANNANTADSAVEVEGVFIALINGYLDAGGDTGADGTSATTGFGLAEAAGLDTDYALVYNNATQADATSVIVTTSPATDGEPCFSYTQSTAINNAPSFSAVLTLDDGTDNTAGNADDQCN